MLYILSLPLNDDITIIHAFLIPAVAAKDQQVSAVKLTAKENSGFPVNPTNVQKVSQTVILQTPNTVIHIFVMVDYFVICYLPTLPTDHQIPKNL